MKSIRKIIREEYIKFLKEYEDINYEYFDRDDEVKQWIFNNFLYKNNADFTKTIPWRVVPFLRLKKIWEDYIRIGVVRDEKGLEMIEDIMISNTFKINNLTFLAGHTPSNPDDDFNDNIGLWVDEQLHCITPTEKIDTNQLEIPYDNPKSGYKEKEPIKIEPCNVQIHQYAQKIFNENYYSDMNRNDIRKILYDEMLNKFYDYYMEDPKCGQGYISDYGLKPLVSLSYELFRTEEPKQKITIIDKMLNIVHQRSDMASWFIQGGSQALSQLSGYEDPEGESVISGKYKLSDYS